MKPVGHFLIQNPNLVGLAFLLIACGFISPFFWSVENISNLLRIFAFVGIVAVGMNIVIIGGGIDLSVGSLAAAIGAVTASLWSSGYPLHVVLFAVFVVALLVGLLNAALVVTVRLQPFIATLVSMTVIRGAGLVYTNGQPIYVDYPKSILFLSQGSFVNIPMPAIILLIVTLLTWYILKLRPIGRSIYAIGANEVTSIISGISVWRAKTFTYLYCALLAALAGLILTARMKSGEPGQAGVFLELDAIAAVVIGGTSLKGGSGSVWGAVVGALMIGVISNMFNLLGTPPEWQNVAKGSIILIAVLIQVAQTRWARDFLSNRDATT